MLTQLFILLFIEQNIEMGFYYIKIETINEINSIS